MSEKAKWYAHGQFVEATTLPPDVKARQWRFARVRGSAHPPVGETLDDAVELLAPVELNTRGALAGVYYIRPILTPATETASTDADRIAQRLDAIENTLAMLWRQRAPGSRWWAPR
jgi:hypothetical protein